MKKEGKVNAMPNPQKKEFNLKYNFFPPKMARVRDFLTFYFRNNFRQKNCKNGVKNPYMLVTRFPLVLTVYRWVRYRSLNVHMFS